MIYNTLTTYIPQWEPLKSEKEQAEYEKLRRKMEQSERNNSYKYIPSSKYFL